MNGTTEMQARISENYIVPSTLTLRFLIQNSLFRLAGRKGSSSVPTVERDLARLISYLEENVIVINLCYHLYISLKAK